MSGLSRVFSKRKIAGEGDRYRPGAQQRQIKKDPFFEYRFDAFLICKNFMYSLYNRILMRENKPLLNFIRSDVRKASVAEGDNIYMSCISTGLSVADRAHLMDAAIAMLQQEVILVIELSAARLSAHEILVEAAKGCLDIWLQRSSENSSSSRQERPGLSALKALAIESPIEVIKEVFTSLQSHAACAHSDALLSGYPSSSSAAFPPLGVITFVCKHAERIDNQVLSELVQTIRLRVDSNQKFMLVLFQPSACPLPLRLDPSLRSLTHVMLHTSITPTDLYDEVLGRLLSAGEVPVAIPAAYALYLHESFFRSHCCVKTILDRY
jgi:hypothetical protein